MRLLKPCQEQGYECWSHAKKEDTDARMGCTSSKTQVRDGTNGMCEKRWECAGIYEKVLEDASMDVRIALVD